MFQYNDCLGSSFYKKNFWDIAKLFQYNDCLGSSIKIVERDIEWFEFQYNDCLGSSKLFETKAFEKK